MNVRDSAIGVRKDWHLYRKVPPTFNFGDQVKNLWKPLFQIGHFAHATYHILHLVGNYVAYICNVADDSLVGIVNRGHPFQPFDRATSCIFLSFGIQLQDFGLVLVARNWFAIVPRVGKKKGGGCLMVSSRNSWATRKRPIMTNLVRTVTGLRNSSIRGPYVLFVNSTTPDYRAFSFSTASNRHLLRKWPTGALLRPGFSPACFMFERPSLPRRRGG